MESKSNVAAAPVDAVVMQFSDWKPHRPETWTHRFAKVKEPVKLSNFKGHGPFGPLFDTVELPAGSVVKIVMVSRFGDVGITEDLKADGGHGLRVELDDLYDFAKSA